jgi:hypothetical protein
MLHAGDAISANFVVADNIDVRDLMGRIST